MKEFIRKKLKSFLGLNLIESNLSYLNRTAKSIDETTNSIKPHKELIALELINKLLPEKTYFPITSWSISPNALAHILNDIIINNRKTIIEFGPGYSTLVIAKLLKLNKLDAIYYAVESSKDFSEVLKQALIKEDLEEYVQIIVAPLNESSYFFKGHEIWYDTNVLNENLNLVTNIDLVIVDGPPGANSHSRFGAIPFIKDKLNYNFSIFLDDTNRLEEAEIAIEWNQILNTKFEMESNYCFIFPNKFVETRPFSIR